VILDVIWAGLPVTRVHAAAQGSMGEAGRHGRKRSRAQPLTPRTALVPSDISSHAPPFSLCSPPPYSIYNPTPVMWLSFATIPVMALHARTMA
jgi:hypothetical protein